jgi:hypothetical protein
MTQFKTLLLFGLGLLCFVSVAGAQGPPPQSEATPHFDEALVVTAVPRAQSASEFLMTFSGPVSVPGVSLAPGSYLFKLPDPGGSAIQVLKADRSNVYALFHTIPVVDVTRTLFSDAHEVTWRERRGDVPPAIKAWFVPGRTTGYEFVYSKETTSAEAQEPRFEEMVMVTATPRAKSQAEHILTFNGPVALPSVSLAPGRYLFRFPIQGTEVIQVLKADGSDSYTMFHTIPVVDVHRGMSSEGYEVTWKEQKEGAPPAIKAWFLPGQSNGYEFVY